MALDMPDNDDCEEIDEPTPEEIAKQYVAEHGRVEEEDGE
ncbi:hypothetical protein PT7_P062 (plasmid) [Pusillimonas sp. T7-7]|nr:hypothetical protein PT7_P062 [Pusillimonas sp. T7-7]